ncbi:hypothetical protein F7734_32590 [Scytonema sp. UIC 10036]|uniref:hypothetical protein n=1 Tax=Scytonema sp. UIC 10036 TaxID=2304196 RepID=UPI0012DA5670|nr:hypothetical protein [Scytonema sp. UIC 10036]MUG96826.1 hypothetical protein [Scytonema sp. UIC 10036]
MKGQERFHVNESVQAAKEQKTATIEEYLSRIPQHQFSDELSQIRERLSRLNIQNIDCSLYFPTSQKTGDGIYVEGPRVMVKNIVNSQGTPTSFDFYIDDVSFVTHYAKANFLFLVIAYSVTTANAIVFLDKNYDYIGAITVGSMKTRELRSFLTHLFFVNPAIQTDNYILQFVGGKSGVFSGRIFQKMLLSILYNVIAYAVILFIASIFFH